MATLRIPIDANVIAYYGFDEANETDVATDLSGNGRTLTVNNSPQAQVGRVANSRLFNGSTTYCSIADSSGFRISGDLTILTWSRLDGTNTGGSLLRCIMACDGTTGAQANNTQFALFVDNNGALIYRHEYSTGLIVQFTSAASIIKANAFREIGIIRKTNGSGQCTISLILDNVQTSWASCSVNSVGQSPTVAVPYPDGGSTATFKVGKSDKASDNAFWYGSQDELTIHNIARSFKPYCQAAYYAVALSPLLSKITGHSNVSNVSTADLGGGVRWWTYERDQDIYIVREAPLGLFWPEVRLTSGPGNTPAGATVPAVVYDAVNDLLTVFFIVSGHIYKITASAADIPTTQTVLNLADTISAIKMNDGASPQNNPAFGASTTTTAGGTLFILPTFTTVSHLPVKLRFASDPSFPAGTAGGSLLFDSLTLGSATSTGIYQGILPTATFVNPNSYRVAMPVSAAISGYQVYARYGGADVLLGSALLQGSSYWYYVITRQTGVQYYAIPLDLKGQPLTYKKTNTITDQGGRAIDIGITVVYGRDGDGVDTVFQGAGETVTSSNFSLSSLSVVSHLPVKMRAVSIPDSTTAAGGTLSLAFTITGTGRSGLAVNIYTS